MMESFDFTQITIKDIMAFIGFLLLIFDFGKWLVNFQNPFVQLKDRVDKHDELFEKDKEHLEKVDKSLSKIDNAVTVLGKAMNEMLRHEITGNDVEALKEQQKRLNDFFYGEQHG